MTPSFFFSPLSTHLPSLSPSASGESADSTSLTAVCVTRKVLFLPFLNFNVKQEGERKRLTERKKIRQNPLLLLSTHHHHNNQHQRILLISSVTCERKEERETDSSSHQRNFYTEATRVKVEEREEERERETTKTNLRIISESFCR